MKTKRRVLVACGGDNRRSLSLEVGGIIDDKYILIGVCEGDETVKLLHLTKRELLRNVFDLCEREED